MNTVSDVSFIFLKEIPPVFQHRDEGVCVQTSELHYHHIHTNNTLMPTRRPSTKSRAFRQEHRVHDKFLSCFTSSNQASSFHPLVCIFLKIFKGCA